MSVSEDCANNFKALILLLLALSSFFGVSPQAHSGVFSVAVQAAKKGDYDQAVVLFEALYKRGERNPNLLYNLASCHYKLGHLADAHAYFSQLLDDAKFQALAAYNMGLIETKMGDDVAAIRSFQLSLRTVSADNAALVNLNRKALMLLSSRNSDYRGGLNKSWFASVSASLAHDSNAELLSNELLQQSTSEHADTQYSTILTAQTLFGGDRKNGFQAGGFFNSMRYRTIDANSNLFSLYLNRISAIGSNSKNEYGLETTRQRYLTYMDTYYAAKYRFITQFSDKNRMDFSYRYQWIEPIETTQYWRGSSQDVKAKFSFGELGDSFSFALAYEVNDRLDKTDADPISFSPRRFSYSMGYEYKKLKHSFVISTEYRISRFRGETYDEDNSTIPAQTIILQRNDRKKSFSASYRYSINREWQCALNFYRQINDSNRTLSDFQQSVIGSEILFVF